MLKLKRKSRISPGLPAAWRDARRPWSRAILAALVSIPLTPDANANVVGADTQNFNPTTSGIDFVTVQSASTLDPGVINFGLFLNNAVNTLPYFDDPNNPSGGRSRFTDSLLSADINVGIGLLPGWDFGVSAPQVLMQDVKGEGYHGQFGATGNTEVRVNTKVQLLGDHDGGVAVVGSANINRINNNPYTGQNAGPIYNLELAGETKVSNFAMGLNLGYRRRQPGDSLDPKSPLQPIGDQYIASGALSYLFSSIDTKIIFELFGSKPVKPETDNDERLASSSEALLGLKHDFTTHLAGHFGAGTAVQRGRSTPDARVYLGLNYALGPTFSKPKPHLAELPPSTLIKADPFAGPPQPKEKIVIHDLLFEFDSDRLVVGGADETLSKLVQHLNTKPGFTKLVIAGHTDSVGSDAYNLRLSHRRANTIRRVLIQKYHVPAFKLVAVGHGKRQPIADNGNYQGRQLNRRVEFTIYRPSAKH